MPKNTSKVIRMKLQGGEYVKVDKDEPSESDTSEPEEVITDEMP